MVIVAVVIDMIVEEVMVWLLLFSQVVDVSKQWEHSYGKLLKIFFSKFL